MLWLSVLLFHANSIAANQESDRTPHPWLGSAPGEFVRLIDRGNLSLQINDEKLEREKKQGLTIFRLEIDYRFRYDLLTRSTSDEGFACEVQVQYSQTKLKSHHQVFLRSSFRPTSPWQSSLLKHEFDHVSISTDPRLANIVKGLFEFKKYRWKLSFEDTSPPTQQQLEQAIVRATQSLIHEVETLVQQEYDRLDVATQHGDLDLANRRDFYAELYSAKAMQDSKTETLRQVPSSRLATWNTISPRKLEEHYRITPAQP